MTTTVSKGTEALSALEAAWRQLEADTDAVAFKRHYWATGWLEHLGAGAEPVVVTVGDPVSGLVPLVKSGGPVRTLTFMGHGLSDYVGPLCSTEDEARALGEAVRELLRSVDVLRLRGIRSDDPIARTFIDALGVEPLSRTYEMCPVVDTSVPWDEYLRERKKKFRANLKHMRRRVESQGEVAVAVEPGSEELFEELVEVERACWKWDEGFAFLREPDSRAFFRDIVLADEPGQEMWTLRIDGELAAFALVFNSGGTMHYYWPSFRNDAWGSGAYLMAALVEACCASGLQTFDFLGGDEDYKIRWMTEHHSTLEVIVPGRGVRGRIASLGYRTRWALARSERLREMRKKALVLLRNVRAGS